MRPVIYSYDDFIEHPSERRSINLVRSRESFIKYYLFILILFSLTLFFLINSFSSLFDEKNVEEKNDTSGKEMLKEEKYLFDLLTNNNTNYAGNWDIIDPIKTKFDDISKLIKIEFQFYGNNSISVTIILKSEEGALYYYNFVTNDKLKFTNNCIELTGNLTSLYNLKHNSQASLFKINYFSSIKIIGEILSTNLNVSFQVYASNQKNKIRFYVTSTSVIVLISLLTQLLYCCYIENNVQKSNALSIFFPTHSMIWTMYSIYSNFFLISVYSNYFYFFIFLIILFLLHFASDMKVWVVSVEMKYHNLVIVSTLAFCCLILSFGSFLFKLVFLNNKYFIFLHCIFIWLPQIIYAQTYNITIFPPIAYILIETLYKMYVPMIFCLKEFNLLHYKNELDTFYCNIGFVFLCFLTLVIQFFFKNDNIYDEEENTEIVYKTKDELKVLYSDLSDYQCPICLNYLFYNDILNKEYNDDTQGIVKIKNNIAIKDLFIKGFFKFSYKNAVVKTDFVVTKCKHIFHSTCLEIWFECKKKCPTCRREIYIN